MHRVDWNIRKLKTVGGFEKCEEVRKWSKEGRIVSL